MKRIISVILVTILLVGFCGSAFADNSTTIFGCVFESGAGQVYRNDYFGVIFEGTDTWYLFNAQDTAEIMGYAVDEVFGSAELMEQLKEKGSAFDFLAMKADQSGDNVSIAIQDIGIDILKAVSMDLILDVVEEQLQGMTENGYKDITLTKEDILFCGKNSPSLLMDATLSGNEVHEQVVPVFQGQYLCLITAGSAEKSGLKAILERFQPADPAMAEMTAEEAAVLHKARLLENQGKGLEAMEVLQSAFDESGSTLLETAITRLTNRQWKVSHRTVYISSGDVLMDNAYEYDETGKLIETKALAEDGSVKNREVSNYDENGLPCGSVVYDSDGKETSRTVITCDEQGDPIRAEGSTIIEYCRNPFGDMTLLLRTGKDGEEISRTYYSCDEFGLQTEMTTVSFGEGSTTALRNEYDLDDANHRLSVTSYHAETGNKSAEYEFIFIPLA